MKFDQKTYKKILIALGITSPIAIALRCFTYWKELEITTGFFTSGSAACTIYNTLGFAVFILCLFFSFWKRNYSPERIRHTPSEDVAEGIGANTLLVQNQELFEVEEDLPHLFLQGFARKTAIWEGTLSAFTTFLPGFGFLAYALSFLTNSQLAGDPYNLVFALLSALSGAYFIFTGIGNSSEKSDRRPFFALIPALWCTVRLVIEYRDLARFVNKSLYVAQFLFIISTLLFFLYQAQFLFGKDELCRPNSYAYVSASAVFFGLTGRLPQLFAALGDRVSMDLVDSSSLLIDLAITFYILLKMQAIMKRKSSK